MGPRVAGALIGIVFGLVLCASGMASPVVIRDALLFHEAYLFLFFASAVGTAAVGLQILRRRQERALLVSTPLTWSPEQPARRHVVGAVIFGAGWGIADACPGPIAAQIGMGVPWALLTLAGVAGGIYAFQRRTSVETEPATQPAPTAGSGAPARA
jgi:uncharacterized membrane protein YedE/YeeE